MSSGADFPARLRVLVIDSDNEESKKLETILKNCKYNYEVRTCALAQAALNVLGKKNEENKFDIIITDVNLSDVMDGFQFIKDVVSEFSIPVIMMSRDGDTSQIKKGIACGAVAYLHKPVGLKDVEYIWTHSFRQGMKMKYNLVETSTELELNKRGRKRKVDIKGESSNVGKRLKWTPELRATFVNAVDETGLNVGPKVVLKKMEELGLPAELTIKLTTTHISSFLQKYRTEKALEQQQAQEAQAQEQEQEQVPQGIQQGPYMENVIPPLQSYFCRQDDFGRHLDTQRRSSEAPAVYARGPSLRERSIFGEHYPFFSESFGQHLDTQQRSLEAPVFPSMENVIPPSRHLDTQRRSLEEAPNYGGWMYHNEFGLTIDQSLPMSGTLSPPRMQNDGAMLLTPNDSVSSSS